MPHHSKETEQVLCGELCDRGYGLRVWSLKLETSTREEKQNEDSRLLQTKEPQLPEKAQQKASLIFNFVYYLAYNSEISIV